MTSLTKSFTQCLLTNTYTTSLTFFCQWDVEMGDSLLSYDKYTVRALSFICGTRSGDSQEAYQLNGFGLFWPCPASADQT